MSQDKTAVPGLENSFPADNTKSRMYSRSSSTQVNFGGQQRGTVVPGMEQLAPGVKSKESEDGNSSPVVGFLYSISRQGIGEYWPIHIGSNKIGRSEDCDICLKENTVSEIHAELNVKQMKTSHKVLASIKDVGSKNGIFVNEEELDYSTHECFNNDLITIGLNYKLLLILIDSVALGLTVSKDFMPVEDDDYDADIIQQSNTNFNPYDHNNRAQGGTVPMDGGNTLDGPGYTKFM